MKRITAAVFVVAVLAMATAGLAATIEVSQPVQVTANSYYERGQAVVYDGTNYWLFYGRSTTVTGNYDNDSPETHDYEVYYKKESTVAALPGAMAAKVVGANNTNGYLGETGAAYLGSDVWAFASVDIGVSCDIYGWWTNDGGTSWNEVGPIVTGMSSGQGHHDEIAFGGEMWVVEGSGNFTTMHSATPKTGGWSAALNVDAALTGGMVHFFVDGSDLYLAIYSAGTNYIYKYNSGTVAWDKVDEVTPPEEYDPTLFKVGTDYVFAQAPWVSDGTPGGNQYLIAWSNSALDGSFFDNGHKMVTAGKYGTNSWVDMWPIGFTDNGGTSYLFYSSERNPNPGSEIDGNIWYLEVDWDVSRDHYTYIKEAIDGGSASDAIDVTAGTYEERLTIGKTLDLRGAQYGVDPTQGGARTDPAAESTIDITGLGLTNPNVAIEVPSGVSGVSLAGFTLVGSPTSHYADESIIRSWDDGHTVEDNIMDGYICLLLKGGDNLSVNRNRLVTNKNGIVIQPYAANNVVIDGNAISAGTGMDNDPAGIYMTGTGSCVVSDNTVTGIIGPDTRGKALTGSNLTNLTVSGNTFTGNGYDAISMWGTTTFITISDNDLSNNGATRLGCGIKIKGQDITISGNHVTGNSDAGVMIDRHVIDTERVTVFNNDLSGNTNYGLEVNTALVTDTVDASGNWWGSNGALTVKAEANAGSGADYTPWFDVGTDTGPGTFGFQGDFSVLHVDDDSPQTGTTGRIQEGVDGVAAGGTVHVNNGTYGADPATGKCAYITTDGVNLIGESEAGTIIDGAIGVVGISGSYWPKGIHVQANNVSVQNFTVQGFTGDNMSTGGYGVLHRDYDHDTAGEGYIFYDGCAIDDVTVQICYSGIYALCFTHLTVTDCTVSNNTSDGMFIARGSDYATVCDNAVTGSGDHGIWVGYSWTAVLPSDNATICNNTVDGAREGGISFVGSDTALIEGNVITNVAAEGWSVGALSLKDGASNVTARYNLIYDNDGGWGGYSGTGHGVGIDGTPSNIALHWNSVYGNAGDGCHNYSTVNVDATKCWWGHGSGPGGVGRGLGDEVTAYVLYDPWIGKAGSENIVCVADPETLNVAAPTKTVAVEYLGGGGGLMYGYSVKFSWDGGIASTDPGKVLEGSLLSDLGVTQFFRNPSGTNEITVDCVLKGDLAGVTGPGTMFTIEFTGLSVGTSPIDVTVIKVRDESNAPLAGFYEDDGLLVVDVSAPDVSNVVIENLTLPHTDDFIKDTDAARVTATVTDDDPGFGIGNITANLAGLGGGAAEVPDGYAGNVATWTTAITSVACTPANGTVTVTVTAVDALSNSDSDSDDITSDNIPPVAVTDLAAAQVKSGNDGDGTTQITLTFTAPGDAYETEVYHAGYGDYPEYDDGTGSEPAAPAYLPGAPWVVTGVTATGQTDEPATRDFWYYVVFTKDIAWNVSAVSNKTTGTLDYHLGDVSDGVTPGAGDNYVNSVDFSLMGTTYWKSHGEGGYLNYCDVGPTADLSTDALPTTDDKVDFEDLMMFAINFTTVTFAPPGDMAGMPAVEFPRLVLKVDEVGEEATDLVTARIYLKGNSRMVKGLHSAVSYDADGLELVSVARGELLTGQSDPVFMERLDGTSRVQVDCAVLGRRATIRGSGEVAVLTYRAVGTVREMPRLVAVDLRDRLNRVIENDVPMEPGDSEPGMTLTRTFDLKATPNPFSGRTRIELSLPRAGRVSVQVYDVSGRLVRTLIDGPLSAGSHHVTWDGRSESGERVAPGVYLSIARTGEPGASGLRGCHGSVSTEGRFHRSSCQPRSGACSGCISWADRHNE